MSKLPRSIRVALEEVYVTGLNYVEAAAKAHITARHLTWFLINRESDVEAYLAKLEARFGAPSAPEAPAA